MGRGLGAVATNTVFGSSALNTNTTGAYNSALGLNALSANTIGGSNVALGVSALRLNVAGRNNTASGVNALSSNRSGSYNTASGYNAGNFHANGTTVLKDPEGCVYVGAETRGLNDDDSNAVVIAGFSGTARWIGEGANTTVLGNVNTVSTKLFGSLNQSGGSVTISKPHYLTQTWNAGAIAFTGIQSNITDTASAAGSLLFNLQVNGVDKFKVDKSGNVVASGQFIIAQPGGGISMGEFGNP